MRIVVWRPQTALQGCFGYVSPLWVWEWPTAARLRGPEWPSFMPSALLLHPGFYFLLCFLYALACDMIPKSVLCNSQAGRATHGCSCRPRPPASHGTPPLWARPDAWLTGEWTEGGTRPGWPGVLSHHQSGCDEREESTSMFFLSSWALKRDFLLLRSSSFPEI